MDSHDPRSRRTDGRFGGSANLSGRRRLAPQTPTTGYMELRGDYAFWVAQRIVAFSDEMIRAIHASEIQRSGGG